MVPKSIETETRIRLHGKDDTDGLLMNKSIYSTIKEFMIAALEESFELTLTQLIEIAHARLPRNLHHNIGFHLLQVKRDLIARDVLQQREVVDGRKVKQPVITLKRKTKGKAGRLIATETIL